MENSYKYSLYRINTLLTLFRSEFAIYTISELSEMLSVPKNIIREDIYILSQGVDECETVIFPYEDEDLEDEGFIERLKKGLEDDTPLGAYSRFNAELYLPLDSQELNVLDDFLPKEQFGMKFSKGGVFIKSSPYREDADTLSKIAVLDEHIKSGHTLYISYPGKDGQYRVLEYKPLCIVRYSLENVSYVVSIKGGHLLPLRIDRIKAIKLSENNITINDFEPLKKLPYMWKMDTGETQNVKIKIKAPKNIMEKIKNDIFSMRISFESISSLCQIDEGDKGTWEEDINGEYAIFEGKVSGMTAFKNWINGYGSSIKVIEPKTLRDEIINSAKMKLEKYDAI